MILLSKLVIQVIILAGSSVGMTPVSSHTVEVAFTVRALFLPSYGHGCVDAVRRIIGICRVFSASSGSHGRVFPYRQV